VPAETGRSTLLLTPDFVAADLSGQNLQRIGLVDAGVQPHNEVPARIERNDFEHRHLPLELIDDCGTVRTGWRPVFFAPLR
jgi:hypothetical protein